MSITPNCGIVIHGANAQTPAAKKHCPKRRSGKMGWDYLSYTCKGCLFIILCKLNARDNTIWFSSSICNMKK
jgi:hypothetical protein